MLQTKWFLIFFLIIALFSCQKKISAPESLMIEFIRSPEEVLVLDSEPEFSWVLSPEIRTQSAYRILVASAEKIIKNNEADCWDSGKIEGSRSTEIEYRGSPLLPGKRYYWAVMVWNQENLVSDLSEIQSFKTGDLAEKLTTPNVFEEEIKDPVKLELINDGHLFGDFGKDAFGTLLMKIEASENDTVVVHLGERITSEGIIDRIPPGSVRYTITVQKVTPGVQQMSVDLPPDPRNTNELAVALPDSFPVIMPFRYVEIEYDPEVVTVHEIRQQSYHYYFNDEASYFISSDTILNQVWELCKYSIKATSFTGYYIDGDRERIPYEADALINQLSHYGTDREYSMARRTNEYFIDHPTWPTEWILQTILLFYNDYLYTANLESVEKYYKELRYKTLVDLEREDGLISTYDERLNDNLMAKLGFPNPQDRIRDIVDWPPSTSESDAEYASIYGERDHYDMVEINTVVNSFHYFALKLYAELAGKLNEKSDSLLFADKAMKVRQSINDKLLDSESGIYTDGENSTHSSLHANMIPLAFGIVPEDNKEKVIEFIKSKGMACSVYGSQFLLDGLFEAGAGDYAFSLLTATHDRSWYNMIRTGSTISMEAWDMIYKPNADWNHAWGAAPANIIPRQLWGIKPLEPGFKTIHIKPQLNQLDHSRILVPTIKGGIKAEYTRNEDGIVQYLINIPGNTKAVFSLVNTRPEEIRINGEIKNPDSIDFELLPGPNEVIINPL